MGLSVSLSNALSGMQVGQKSLDILSRNVANAGTPGYHRQSLSVIDKIGTSAYASASTVTRAFSQSLQAHYTSELSNSGYADTRASALDRLQAAFGKPGDPGGLDTAFNDFQASLGNLATSPDNFATRSEVIAKAQTLASTLNRLSDEVQSLRQESDSEIGTGVADVNRTLQALQSLNGRLADQTADPSARSALMDQRDRLVGDLAGQLDIKVTYRDDGTVSIMTRSGIGLLDTSGAATFSYQGVGQISSGSVYDQDPDQSGVGRLTMTSPSGLVVDLVGERVVQSGKLGALVNLRDETLVRAQTQLDDIAAALSQSLSTVETGGTPQTVGAATGFDIDLGSIRPGNDIVLDYTVNGAAKQVRVVRVEDSSQLPMDYKDANGTRVIGMSFAGGAAGVASQLQGIFGSSLQISSSGSTLRILDDGGTNVTNVTGLKSHATVSASQGAGLALSLFVDSSNADFTDIQSADPQRRGFSARIAVNSSVLSDNRLLVQSVSGGSLGDASRAVFLRDKLETSRFVSADITSSLEGNFRLSGTTGDMISQALNYQGASAASAATDKDSRDLTLEALTQRMDSETGVNVDEEMARLMELQNAFAANARVVSTVQELINALLNI